MAQLLSTYRPGSRLGLTVLASATAALVWMALYQGEAPTAASTPEEGLAALLLDQEGLTATELGFLQAPTSQGRGWVPAFALARPSQGDIPEDAYYLEARVRADGMPLQLRRVSNLTRTPYAREHLLARQEQQLLLGVEVFSQQQALLQIDFSGDERDLSALHGELDKARYQITSVQTTGRAQGVGQRLFALDPPPRRLSAQGDAQGFAVSLFNAEGKKTSLRVGADGALEDPQGRARYQPRFFAAKAATPWLVDTIRDLSWVGPRKIALLEKFVFRWAETLKQTAWKAGLVSDDGALQEELAAQPTGPAVTLTLRQREDKDWPPPRVKPGVEDAEAAEGVWTPVQLPWLRTLPGAPPAFYKTAVRMDPKRPYDAIALIAADMRQLDLSMVAGTVTPESSFGNRGTGLIPRGPESTDRLVAAFNGGFKTAHGAFGMVVDHTTILPPIPYSATLAVKDNGQVAMGTWYNSMTPPPDIRSLRQNLPPLMANGRFNPTGKRKWGGTASDLDDIHTTRSAAGVRAPNALVYAWCKSCSADALGAALLAAGCQYGMHLDMNPTHTGWSYYRTDDEDLDKEEMFSDFKVAKGSPRMDFDEARYIKRDVKDFFYLTLRQDLTSALPAPPEGFAAWSVEGAPRGPSGIMPLAAISRGSAPGDVLVALDASRVSAQARLGDKEFDPTRRDNTLNAPAETLALTLKAPSAWLDLGLASDKAPGALYSGGRIVSPPQQSQPALVVHPDGTWGLVEAAAAQKLNPRQVSLLRAGPALIRDGAPTSDTAPQPGQRQHALGADAQGRLYYLTLQEGGAQALRQHLLSLKVTQAILLPAGPQTRLWLVLDDSATPQQLNPADGKQVALDIRRDDSTHVWFERQSGAPRVQQLKLEDVALDPDEARRQRRLQAQIQALRQELRRIENAKYKAWIEKKNGGKP